MPQVIGDLSVTGQQLGLGIGGPVFVLTGQGDPNTLIAPVLASASVGSIFLRVDDSGGLYLKTSAGTPGSTGTWTAK